MGNDKNNSNANNLTWARSLVQSDQAAEPAKEGSGIGASIAATLANVADRSTGWMAEQIHAAGQDVVSRVLLDETYSHKPGEQEHEPQRDKDEDPGMDR